MRKLVYELTNQDGCLALWKEKDGFSIFGNDGTYECTSVSISAEDLRSFADSIYATLRELAEGRKDKT